MDLSKLTHHKSYGATVAMAIGLSALAVAVAAVVGRSTVNLKGDLVAERVTVPVVIRLIGDAHPEEIVTNVEELPPRPEIVGSTFVVNTDVRAYYVRVSPTKPWTLLEEKAMRGADL